MPKLKLSPIGSNMTELQIGDLTVLFSYKTPVAYENENGKCFRTSHSWSNTTSKHINKWLNGRQAENVDQDILDGLVNG